MITPHIEMLKKLSQVTMNRATHQVVLVVMIVGVILQVLTQVALAQVVTVVVKIFRRK